MKKQNIVREYVCCECSTTKDPFMCRICVFLLRTVTRLRSTVDSVFILNTCSTAEHQPAAATNLKQLPHQKRHSSKYKDRTEAGGNWLKEWQCILVEKDQQSQSFCYAWLRLAACFSRGWGWGCIFSWSVVKCVGTRLKIARNHRKIEATVSKNCLPLVLPPK